MDAIEVKQKVLKVLDDFGMSGAKAAEAMNVTYATFRNKKNDRPGHSFNENNYLDLIKFINKKNIEIYGVSNNLQIVQKNMIVRTYDSLDVPRIINFEYANGFNLINFNEKIINKELSSYFEYYFDFDKSSNL